MSHRLSQNARHTNELLEELERDKELDVLREYLSRFDLFPRKRDPASAPIRFEELKELVKHWKLHRQRNFWKNHTTKEDLVRTLYRHINTKIIPQENREECANGGGVSPTNTKTSGVNANPVSGATIPIAPTAPAGKPSIASGALDSPRSKSILVNARALSKGPKREHIFNVYCGDLFSQRGDYEDGMIYLSRFRKPMESDATSPFETTNESNQDQKPEPGDQETHEKSLEMLDIDNGLSREARLKQECSFSIYHFTISKGNEKRMVAEGAMLAISRLAIFDDIEVKKFCAAAILNLTWEMSLCVKMIEEGVLLALLELAKAQHEEIRRNTSMALCRFSYERTGQLRLVQEGCVSAIVSMLNSPDYETKEACVKALINIASHSGSTVSESVVQTVLKISAKKEVPSINFSAEAIYNLSLLNGSRAKVVEDGILDNFHDLCQYGDDCRVKVHLATALCNFSGIPSNLELLSQVRILECLEGLLKYENEVVREMCAITIANISSHPTSLKNLVLSDAVVQLAQMCHEANQVIQENTALSLSNVSATTDSCQLLGRFGVVSLLLHFLEESSSQAKQYSIVALCSLMMNPSTCSELLQSNIPMVLAHLSSSSNDKVKELCANALFNLSCEKSIHSFLLKDEIIKASVRLCKKMHINKDGIEVEDEINTNDKTPIVLLRSQECALGCLFNLSFFEESRKVLIRVDVVKTLFNLFQRPVKNDEHLKQCAAVIANLSFDVESRARMIEDGCVRLIRKLMSSSSKDTLLCCSIASCNLAADALEKTPILSMLIDLSSSPHSSITLNCAIAFSKLASNASYRPTLTKCAELYPALTLMMRCGIEDIQIYSAVTLCNLASERNQRTRHIWKEGTVPDFIVNSLLRINSDSTKEICARALYNLLTHDEYRMAHIKEGVLYALVKLARLESVEIRSLCVTALYNLSCDPTMIDILMEINVAQVITKMCEIEFSNQDIHRRLAACLTNIAMKPGTEMKLVEGGALVAMLVLSEHNDPPTMRYCASVLCYLSSQRANCETIAASNLVEVLVKIISSEDAQQNLFGLNALCNISCVPTLHDRIEDAGAIAQIIRLFSTSSEEEIQLACAQTLYNLTYHTKYRKVMLQKDLIHVLHVVFDRTPISPSVVDVCVQITAILCEDPQYWNDLVMKGAVKVLRSIVRHCSPPAVMHCIYALCQLARSDKTGLTVLNDGALGVVAVALSLDTNDTPGQKPITLELSERCSIILRTLSTFTECLAPLMEDTRLISIIRAITMNNHKESCKNSILALYNITSTKSPAMDTLVENNIVELLIHLSTLGGADMAPACGIALAHIKHIEKDRDRPSSADGDNLKGEMIEGIVTTLLPMIDMDQSSIQKVDRMALTLPANLPPLRAGEWIFLQGNTSIRLGHQLPVSWTIHTSSIDDTRFVPAEPKSFLTMLVPVVPTTGMSVQDKLYGSFEVMKVRADKYHIKRVDPRFLKAAAAAVSDDNSDDLAAAIALAMQDDMDIGQGEDSGTDHRVGVNDNHVDEFFDNGMDEVRAPAPPKKKGTLRSIVRSGSYRGLLADNGLTRRSSKTNHKGSKPSIMELRGSSKRETNRKQFTGITDSDRGVILPKL